MAVRKNNLVEIRPVKEGGKNSTMCAALNIKLMCWDALQTDSCLCDFNILIFLFWKVFSVSQSVSESIVLYDGSQKRVNVPAKSSKLVRWLPPGTPSSQKSSCRGRPKKPKMENRQRGKYKTKYDNKKLIDALLVMRNGAWVRGLLQNPTESPAWLWRTDLGRKCERKLLAALRSSAMTRRSWSWRGSWCRVSEAFPSRH